MEIIFWAEILYQKYIVVDDVEEINLQVADVEEINLLIWAEDASSHSKTKVFFCS